VPALAYAERFSDRRCDDSTAISRGETIDSAGSYVRFAPKATEMPRDSEMTQSAINVVWRAAANRHETVQLTIGEQTSGSL
jgi:hypothetical protein